MQSQSQPVWLYIAMTLCAKPSNSRYLIFSSSCFVTVQFLMFAECPQPPLHRCNTMELGSTRFPSMITLGRGMQAVSLSSEIEMTCFELFPDRKR